SGSFAGEEAGGSAQETAARQPPSRTAKTAGRQRRQSGVTAGISRKTKPGPTGTGLVGRRGRRRLLRLAGPQLGGGRLQALPCVARLEADLDGQRLGVAGGALDRGLDRDLALVDEILADALLLHLLALGILDLHVLELVLAFDGDLGLRRHEVVEADRVGV